MSSYEELAPNFKRALLEKAKTHQPLWGLLGIELVDVKKGWAKMRLPFSEKLGNAYGAVHGGALFSLADSAVAMALQGLVERGKKFTTIEMKINYVSSFEEGEVTAEARISGKGSRIALGEVDVRNQGGRLVAKCLATYMVGSKPL